MPDEARLDGQPPEPSLRRRRPRSRARIAASRHVSSLRRSQRRLAGEEHPTPVVVDEARPASHPANRTKEAADTASSTRARLGASLLHPGRGQILAAIILFIVGVAGAMQIQINATDDTYASARREDLIQLLDGLSTESRRLEGEIAAARADQEQSAVRCRHATRGAGGSRKAPHRAVHSGWHGRGGGTRDPGAYRRSESSRRCRRPSRCSRGNAGRWCGGDRGEQHDPGCRINVVRLGSTWPGHRRQAGQSADHARGDRGATRFGGSCAVPGRNRLRDHGTQDRWTSTDRPSGPACDRIVTRVERESVRSSCTPAVHPSMTV